MPGLNDKELAELRKTFDSCDLNGDGFINPEEFHALLIKLDGDVSREECLRGGPTFSDTGISGFLSGHDRREVHAKAET